MTAYTFDQSSAPAVGLAVESPYLWRARRVNARHRLICFPPAGGGAGAFGDWASALPPEIEVAAIQLPGRQNRMFEEPATDVGQLVRDVREALRPVLDGPFSFFGHSSGALLAHEVARSLQLRRAPTPAHLFVSGESAPEAARGRPSLHTLSPEAFRAEVLRLGGFDEELADDEEALDEVLEPVIADFRLWENHRSVSNRRLDCPITALGGDCDPRATPAALGGWRDHTTASFTLRIFAGGGHFYLFQPPFRHDLLELIGDTLLAETTTDAVR